MPHGPGSQAAPDGTGVTELFTLNFSSFRVLWRCRNSKKPSCGKVRQKDAKRLKLRPFGPAETGDEAGDAFSVLPAQSWSYQVQEDDADAACGELFENVMPRYTWALCRHGLQVIAQVCSSKFFPDQYTYCTLGF